MSADQSTDTEAPETSDAAKEAARLIELMRPAIQADGGDVEFVELTGDGTVLVRMHGACIGCPSSSITLKAGIERHLRDRIPGVERVEAVD